jgi:hypothetical protein
MDPLLMIVSLFLVILVATIALPILFYKKKINKPQFMIGLVGLGLTIYFLGFTPVIFAPQNRVQEAYFWQKVLITPCVTLLSMRMVRHKKV